MKEKDRDGREGQKHSNVCVGEVQIVTLWQRFQKESQDSINEWEDCACMALKLSKCTSV